MSEDDDNTKDGVFVVGAKRPRDEGYVIHSDAFSDASPRAREEQARKIIGRVTGVESSAPAPRTLTVTQSFCSSSAPTGKIELEATYRCRTGLARAWIRLVALLAPVLGRARMNDWAIAGARRLISVRLVSALPKGKA